MRADCLWENRWISGGMLRCNQLLCPARKLTWCLPQTLAKRFPAISKLSVAFDLKSRGA
jgi:hypothetical protein